MADEQDARSGDTERGSETHQLGPPGGGSPSTDLDPETAAEYRQAARAALRGGETDLAVDRLDRAVTLAEDAADDALAAGALVDRGNARMERVGEDPGDPRAEPDAEAVREASTADLERAVELSERHAFLVRGNSYAEAGADRAAREDFTRAVETTDAARAYFNRGNANRRLGEGDAARRDYRAALDDPAEAARHRVRAAWVAVATREVWAGVNLATTALREGPDPDSDDWDPTGPCAAAAALVLAGDALDAAAGYGGDDVAAGVDTDALRAAAVAAFVRQLAVYDR